MAASDAAAAVPPGKIAGFWIRVLSDLLDAIFLGLCGFLLSLPLRGVFVRLGERGVLIGLAISLAYAGLLQSRLGGGQTLAKRLLKLRVVKLDGTLLSVDRSLLRYMLVSFMVYQTPLGLGVVTVLPGLPIQWVSALFGTLALVLFLGCVVVVPFHPLKRGLHDLLTGTVVVRGGPPDLAGLSALANPRRDRGILIGALSLAVLSLVFSAILSRRPLELPGGISGPSELTADLPIDNAVITDAVEFRNGTRSRTLVLQGLLRPPPGGGDPDFARAHDGVTRALRARIPAGAGVDKIGTRLRSGFHIGIYSQYQTRQQLEAVVR